MSRLYKAYLSSTLKDLKLERDAVKAALAEHALVSESYSASESDLVTSCLRDLRSCDLVILVVGLRYGYVPEFLPQEGEQVPNTAGLSITCLEYRKALEAKIPVYVFLKIEGNIVATDTDAYTGENPKERIEGFRSEISSGKEHRPAQFSTSEDLKTRALSAFINFKTLREKETALLDLARRSHVAEIRFDIAVQCVPSTDDPLRQALHACGDSRVHVFELSPDDPRFLKSLDERARLSRTLAVLLTRESLPRFKARTAAISGALACIGSRNGGCFALLDGVSVNELEPTWSFLGHVAVPAGTTVNAPAPVLEELYRRARAQSLDLVPDRRIALPYVVISLTADQAERLLQTPDDVFTSYPPATRNLLRAQFDQLVASLGKPREDWVAAHYGASADGWRPFVASDKTITEILLELVARLNDDRRPGSREKRLLGDFKLQPRRYGFEEFVTDAYGSKDNLVRLRDAGMLVVVDELALFHPAVRKAAHDFLSSAQSVIVTAGPCDPAHVSTESLLDEHYFAGVGTMRQRFGSARDHLCELTLNSLQRLERWLWLVLPELAAALDQREGQPDLVDKADALFT